MFLPRKSVPPATELPPVQMFQVDITDVHDHEVQLANLRLQNRFYTSLVRIPEHKTSLAISGDELLGYAFTTHRERRGREPSTMVLGELCVAEQYRRHNLGAALLHHTLVTWEEVVRTERVELISRHQAKAFYKRIGFESVSFAGGASGGAMAAQVDQLRPLLAERASAILCAPDAEICY